mgnify:FL=1
MLVGVKSRSGQGQGQGQYSQSTSPSLVVVYGSVSVAIRRCQGRSFYTMMANKEEFMLTG